LDVVVEILHAQAGAVKAALRERCDIACIDVARIELDGDVAVVRIGDAEVTRDGVQRFAQLHRREEIRRAAAEVHLDHFAIAVE
jgi:hypothetical protein